MNEYVFVIDSSTWLQIQLTCLTCLHFSTPPHFFFLTPN